MRANSHIGDIGTTFRLQLVDENNTPIDVSNASLRQIIFKKPSGVKLTKTASLNTTGTDGKIKYVSVNGDLDVAGTWSMQAKITVGTATWYTTSTTFTVEENL